VNDLQPHAQTDYSEDLPSNACLKTHTPCP